MERQRRPTYLQACDLLRIANEISDDDADDGQNQVPCESVNCELEEKFCSEDAAIDDEGDIEVYVYEEECTESEDGDSISEESEEEQEIECGEIIYRCYAYSSTTLGKNFRITSLTASVTCTAAFKCRLRLISSHRA